MGNLKVQLDAALGSMRQHSKNEIAMQPKAILEAGFTKHKDLICFFPVRGLAFTSLKVGVGHRLDSQASGVLGRWCSEPGVQ